jgi:TolB protein
VGEPDIVYAGPTDDASEVFSSNISGLIPQQLTSLGGYVAFPVWSPDGNRVLFVAMNEDSANVMILDTESGESSVALANNGNPADWGPRGERILVTKDDANGRGLYLIIVATGAEERVDTGSTSDAYARWGRDGAAVVYESSRNDNPEIYLTNPDSGETRRLTENSYLDEWPSLSRDGSQVAWASGTEEDKNLWVMNVDGSQKRQITESMMFGDAFPEWSPDGSQILLTVRENGQFMLKLIDLVSGQVTHIGEGAGASWK